MTFPVAPSTHSGQFQDHHLVQAGDGFEVEAIEALDRRELCRLSALYVSIKLYSGLFWMKAKRLSGFWPYSLELRII